MKELLTFSILITFIFLIGSHCKKSNIDTGCGCNTDSIAYSFVNRQGVLHFYSQQNQNAWFITIEFPPYSQEFFCMICNPNQSSVKAITDTMPTNHILPIIFTGHLTNLCSNESFGFQPANISPFHITVDSLKK